MTASMFRVLVAMFAVLVGSASAPGNIAWADAAPAKIDSSYSFLTYECGNQSPIRIVGQDSTITLNGSCGEVDVSGAANTVNLQTVAVINATGAGNHITWEKGPAGGVPRINNPGHNNDIHGPGGLQLG
ncbi:DUF3060 domain-containing protein [Mycobacterium sp. Aquia_216]|uniref:DUF3060 domain-containing protein n=1 Tax=Mycobacterium sp. Aquia_216 TaxID=2991729 RepID=UPI00227BC95A|nr:DUF3060 domain-containing protein [Mycobacterium sp. Aquia_216]WAJ44882.1 DUF3060 domain-containing protein [Mycobacterium sp. Aquia_216]